MAADAAGHEILVRIRQPFPAEDTFDVWALNAGTSGYQLQGMNGTHGLSREIFLAEEVVERALYEYPDAGIHLRSEIRSWSRNDGHPVTILPVDRGAANCTGTWLVAVPGAVLTNCLSPWGDDQTSTEIVGFVTTP